MGQLRFIHSQQGAGKTAALLSTASYLRQAGVTRTVQDTPKHATPGTDRRAATTTRAPNSRSTTHHPTTWRTTVPYEYVIYNRGQEIRPQGGHPAADISQLITHGLTIDESVEMLDHRAAGRSSYVTTIVKAISAGATRAEADEALETNRPAIGEYLRMRREGTNHQQAIDEIRDLHVCQATESRNVGELNPVLGTGEVTHITSCRCGAEMWRSAARKNWSGD